MRDILKLDNTETLDRAHAILNKTFTAGIIYVNTERGGQGIKHDMYTSENNNSTLKIKEFRLQISGYNKETKKYYEKLKSKLDSTEAN